MVAIVSGNNLGLNLGSLALLGQQGAQGAAAHGSSGERVYVNAASGNLVLQTEDERLAGRGPDAVALRTYNSQGLLNDDNGDGWTSGTHLQPLALSGTLNAAGSTLLRTDRDGAASLYSHDAARGLYRSTDGDGAHDSIAFIAADNQLEWRDGGTGLVQRYEAAGAFRLLATRDPAGQALTYAYNAAGRLASVLSASGETTFYDYAGNNLTQLRTVSSSGATATRVRYGYDASNRLATVTVDLSPADNAVADGLLLKTTYSYDGSSRRVSKIVQSDGTSLTLAYTLHAASGSYRVESVTNALNQKLTFAYSATAAGVAGSTTVTDPLGAVTTLDYDAAGRLTRLAGPAVNGAVAERRFGYNGAGDVLSVTDGLGRVTSYEYDANGNETLQRDAAGNTVSRSFDARNQLLTETVYAVADADGAGTASQPSAPLTTRYVYDAGGRNLLRFALSAEGRVTEHRYNGLGERTATLVYGGATYGVGALALTAVPTEADMATWAATQSAGPIQRQDLAYDARGELQSRTRYARTDAQGAGVSDGSQARESYVYDSAGRLLQVVSPTGGSSLFTYDGADRVIQSGPVQQLPADYTRIINEDRSFTDAIGQERRLNRYDANGRILRQQIYRTDNGASKSDVIWNPAETVTVNGTTYAPDGYDAAGNVLGYVVQNVEGAYVNEYRSGFKRFEGYMTEVTAGTSSKFAPGSTTQQYDPNGFLTAITDSAQPLNNRTFVNDAEGRALFVNQGGNVQRQLIVNGEVLGIYGAGPSATSSSANPSFDNLVDFDFGYSRISAAYPNPAPGVYTTRAGDTLQSIAYGAYGDSALWYRIAEANGLTSNSDLRAGQTLTLPNRVSSIHNNTATFKPYDPSRIEGDKTPYLPMPANDKGCGGVGQVLMVIVAIVVTIYSAGAAAGLMNAVSATATSAAAAAGGATLNFAAGLSAMTGATVSGVTVASGAASMASMAIGAAVGSVASQLVGIATGVQEKFNWKGVGLSTVSAGMTNGLGYLGLAVNSSNVVLNAVANASISNVLTQGIGVATGLQRAFDWRGVAASAVGAGVGQAVAGPIGNVLGKGSFGTRLATALIAGTAAAGARGERIAIQQVAVDAFGNAIGQSVADEAARDPRPAFTADQPSEAVRRRTDAAAEPYIGAGLKLDGRQGLTLSSQGVASWSAQVDQRIAKSAFSAATDSAIPMSPLHESAWTALGQELGLREVRPDEGWQLAQANIGGERSAKGHGVARPLRTTVGPELSRQSMAAYWTDVEEAGLTNGSFSQHILGKTMRGLGNLWYDAGEAVSGAINKPSDVRDGLYTAVTNLGPDSVNGAVNLLKASLSGWTMIGEKVALGDGYFSGFRSSNPFNIAPLLSYENKTQAAAGLLGGLGLGSAVSKIGGYGVTLEDIGAMGPMSSQLGAIRLSLVTPNLGAARLVAINREGMVYPEIPDLRTGRAIPFPEGELTRFDKSFRDTWTMQDRHGFIKEWHERGYPTPRGGWSEYDIHHIKPVEFGGDKRFWNLAPVQRKTHKDMFNAFWRKY